MSAIETQLAEPAAVAWSTANQDYLRTGLARLRLLLERRILWQRTVWKQSLAKESQGFQGLVITDSEADLLLNANDPAAEAHFYDHDDDARSISQRLSEPLRSVDGEPQPSLSPAGLPALEIVARLFRLGPFERDVLLLCLAPEIDAGFERLYAYVQDDVNRKYPTANLAVQVLGSFHFGDTATAREHFWDRFAPEAPLCRFRLLRGESTSGGSWAHEPLRLERRIGSYLLGVNFLDEQTASFLRVVDDVAPLSVAQDEIVQRLEHRLRTWTDRDRVPATNVVSREPGAAKAIARHLCSRIGIALYALDPARLPALAVEREACYRVLERESMLLPCAYYIDAPEAGGGEANQTHGQTFGQSADNALEVARSLRAILFAASPEPLSGEKSFITVRVPQSDAQAQFDTWQARLGDQLPGNGTRDAFLGRLVQQFHFGPQQIHRVVCSAIEVAALRNPDAPTLDEADLWLAARGHAVRSMEGLAEKIEARRGFDDLVLPTEAMQQLRDIASQVEQRDRVYEQWGFGAKLSRGRGIVALFAGPSGTGKTMAAEVLAHRLDLDLYRIDLAGVISKFIGETEKNLKRVFDAAEQSGAILFFDEADALFGKRSEVRDSHDRYANIEINYLLQRMEDYRGLAILATNRKALLDQAFLRRLRFLIDFPLPAASDRLRIWRGSFPAQAQLEPLDYELLGRLEVSGGSITNIALNAAFLAASEQTSIGMNHVLVAARREYSKIDKLMLESEFGRYYKAGRR